MIKNPHYLYRMTMLMAISMLSSAVSHDVLVGNMLPIILNASKDTVCGGSAGSGEGCRRASTLSGPALSVLQLTQMALAWVGNRLVLTTTPCVLQRQPQQPSLCMWPSLQLLFVHAAVFRCPTSSSMWPRSWRRSSHCCRLVTK